MEFNSPPAGRLIGIMSNMMHRIMGKMFSAEPYGAAETACITFICDRLKENPEKSVFQRDIEKEFNLRSPSASASIKNLEQKGLLVRENIEGDGRKKKLIPTEKGLEYDSRIKSKLHDLETIIIKDVSPEDLETFRRVSKQMIENLQMEEING